MALLQLGNLKWWVHLQALIRSRVIVKEYISETKGAKIWAFIVDGKVVGAMKRIGKDGEFISNLHQGRSSSLINLTKKEREALLTVARFIGLPIVGVNLLQPNRGSLILEVNSSLGLQGIENTTNKDTAEVIINYVVKKNEERILKPFKRRKIKSNI